MFETVKEVDEEKVTKNNNILSTRKPNASLLSDDVEYSDEIKHSLIIEEDVTTTSNALENLKMILCYY